MMENKKYITYQTISERMMVTRRNVVKEGG